MAFEDLDQFFDDGIDLPIGGKTYRIQAPDAELGLWCQRLVAAGYAARQGEEIPSMPRLDLDDDDEMSLYRRLCGPTWDELMADGVSWPKLQVVGSTILLWVGVGLEAAEAFWRSGGDPNSSGPTRAQRRARGSTATVAAPTTRKRDSTSGTRSRRSASAA